MIFMFKYDDNRYPVKLVHSDNLNDDFFVMSDKVLRNLYDDGCNFKDSEAEAAYENWCNYDVPDYIYRRNDKIIAKYIHDYIDVEF